jgi:hypothetical protein
LVQEVLPELEISDMASRSAEGVEMNWLHARRRQFQDWLDGFIERRRVFRLSSFAGDIERQIREQLNQHHQARIADVRQAAFEEGVSRTRETYQREYDLLRAQVHAKEVIISELKASQILTQKPKRIQRRKQSRKGKRI